MKLKWVLVFFLFTLSSCKKNSSFETTAPSILQMIPEKDYDQLDAFFQLIFRYKSFAYTLFGSKPMSMCCYLSTPNLFTLYHPKEFLTLERGWEVWKRYFSCFPSDHFVLKKVSVEDGPGRSIFLIHKKCTLQVIKNHLDTFHRALGSIDPKQLLERLCNPNEDIEKVLQGHANLLGILLGYGEANAMHFERMVDIAEYLEKKMTPPFSSYKEIQSLSPDSRKLLSIYNKKMAFPSSICTPSPQYSSLAEELNNILLQRTIFELNDWMVSKIVSPVFMSRKQDIQTEILRKDYKATMKKLRKVYREDPFLEVTLTQWMAPK